MKSIIWDTNFNGKMDCNQFVHIDYAPEKMPSMEDLEKAVFKLFVADKSHPPITAKVHNIVPFPVTQLANIHTWPSHGMDSAEFIEWIHRKKAVTRETQLAVYYYKKVDE